MEDSILTSVRALIVELRNRREVDSNWLMFGRVVSDNAEHILSRFSMRWLVSICDTYADFGNPIERRNAFLISLYVNMIRIADTYRHVLSSETIPTQVQALKDVQIELYDGLETLHLDRQDTCLNLSKRMIRLLIETPFFMKMYEVITTRLLREKTLLSDFASLSEHPENVFPLNATGMADNHGVV